MNHPEFCRAVFGSQPPLAEDLDVAQVQANGTPLTPGGWPKEPMLRFWAAWNSFELGVATQDETPVDEAFAAFRSLVDHPKYNITKRPFVDVRVVLAYEGLMRVVRLTSRPASRQAINAAYRGIGMTLGEIAANARLVGDVRGKYAECLVDGALLRAKNTRLLPQPGSPREESSKPAELNHDRYLFDTRAGRVKWPLSVRANNVAPIGLRTQFGKALDGVREVSLLDILSGILNDLPELKQEIKERTHIGRHRDNLRMELLGFAGELMEAESTGYRLSGSRLTMLNELTSSVMRRCLQDTAAHAQRASEPLTYGLGELLRAAGFRHSSEEAND